MEVCEEFKVENYLARVSVEIVSMVFIFLVEVFANFKALELRLVTVSALGSHLCNCQCFLFCSGGATGNEISKCNS